MKNYKTILLALSLLFIQAILLSQPFQIGQHSVTFNDPDRNNRSIPVQIFYPAIASGTNIPVAEGEYPVLVFGHGFVMVYSAYQFLWQALVPQGYILVFPTTEGSLFPSHQAFGLDLRFLNGKMQSEGLNPASLFLGHIADHSAIMGHSMGGGAAFLACENSSEVSTLITFAAAETNPSAIQAATSIQVPSLVFSASNDCVTPPSDHQVPMYNNLASECKTFISITGGGHCYMADYNFNCAFGEATCSPSPAITRDQQHAIILTHLFPYLEFMLKGNQQSWIEFNNLLNNPSGITSLQSCNIRLVDIKAYLEGPFNGTEMNDDLTGLSDFPFSQPYNISPWNYNGTETVNSIPAGVVDWILLELRDATSAGTASTATTIAREAAFLMNNGHIRHLDGISYPQFDNLTIQHSLFAVVHHRNHLAILTANPLTESGGVYSYDFTTSAGQAYNSVQTDLGDGHFGMYSSDANADGIISTLDKTCWTDNTALGGYKAEDFNLDAQVNNLDKNDFWIPNEGEGNQVPD